MRSASAARRCGRWWRNILDKMTRLAIYIHWPFCVSKCPYCDFNSHVADAVDHAAWAAAYRRELAHYAALLPGRRVTSVFFGGGTPSLMAPQTVEAVLQTIAASWTVAEDVEITLEANPTSAEAEKFAAFRAAGVNRLSLGVQSLRDDALKFLGRAHDAAQARRALEWAARHFPRYSFDLIYARRDQMPEAWAAELREALAFGASHMSLYQLTIEPNTVFHTLARRDAVLTARDDDAAAMFEATNAAMAEAGLPAYEISNYAAPGAASRHNLTYWRYEPYIGIGPGAHGRRRTEDGIYATENHRAPEAWLRQVAERGHGLKVDEALDTLTAQREALMMGLRLVAGIDGAAWREKFGGSVTQFLPSAKLARLRAEGLLSDTGDGLRATPSGLQRLNAVLAYLLG